MPNATGFVLGSAQLILYAMYTKKSGSEKSAMEEEGSPHLVKGGIEMLTHNDEDDKMCINNRSLNKGKSLPKPTVNRQNSLKKILKTLSLNVQDLQSGWLHDIELGNRKPDNDQP